MKRLILILMFATLHMQYAVARPVSYPGGWTIITENNGDQNYGLVHYTFTPKLAVGYRVDYDRDSKDTFHGVQMNNLLKRWNNPDSQANIYLKSAAGVSAKGSDLEGMIGMQADWEDRRWMIMYENNAMASPNDMRREFRQSLGLGVAPYVAEFGSLHTWIMPHILHQPEDKKNWQFAPMLRMFKGPVLFEAGYNVTTKTPLFNAMIRF